MPLRGAEHQEHSGLLYCNRCAAEYIKVSTSEGASSATEATVAPRHGFKTRSSSKERAGASETPLTKHRAEESQEVWKEGHAAVNVLLGAPVADKKSARTADGGLTPFVTGYAAEPHKDAKDEKAAPRFRGSFLPEIRNPANHYISVPAARRPSKPPVNELHNQCVQAFLIWRSSISKCWFSDA